MHGEGLLNQMAELRSWAETLEKEAQEFATRVEAFRVLVPTLTGEANLAIGQLLSMAWVVV